MRKICKTGEIFEGLRSALNAGHLAGHYCQRTMYAGKIRDTPPAYLGICRRKGVRWAQRVQRRRPMIKAAGVKWKGGAQRAQRRRR